MRTIWYFVGLILLSMGVIILISGIYSLMNPPEQKTVFNDYNPDIWWGIIMSIAGIIYLVSSKGKRVS